MVSSFSPEVRSIPKRIRLDEKDRNYVAFEGRWSLTTSPEDSTLPAANSVQVRCWKEMGRCTEAIAMLYRKSDSNSMSDLSGRLSVIMFEHQITEWSDTVIRTQSQPPAADIEIRISLVDRSAELSQHETYVRGAYLADPKIVQHWILQ
jgi:hypothetical protein